MLSVSPKYINIPKVMERMLSIISKYTLPKYWKVCSQILHCQSYGKYAFEHFEVNIAKSMPSNTSKYTLPKVCHRIIQSKDCHKYAIEYFKVHIAKSMLSNTSKLLGVL